ncbi:MAG: NfeD family protein [Anaerolineales bacterium]|jgi:membrane-bound serine protease (ClpP class)
MNILLNANIAYLLLMFGSIFVMMALVTPGTHLLEGGALLLLAVAGYEVFQLGFNVWALIVLILALVPFIYAVYAVQRPRREWALALSILALIVGSLYLFPGKGWIPAVNPILAVIISALSAGFLWLAVRKGMQAHLARPLQDLKSLIGQIGQAKTEVSDTGSVQVASELWSARSEKPIPAGSRIRVISREGFKLVVEADDQSIK